MMKLFQQIWEETPESRRVCFETGEKIYDATNANFHHVLEKSKYPEYTMERWNIILVSVQTHDQVHKDIDKTPKIKGYRRGLLVKHTSSIDIID